MRLRIGIWPAPHKPFLYFFLPSGQTIPPDKAWPFRETATDDTDFHRCLTLACPSVPIPAHRKGGCAIPAFAGPADSFRAGRCDGKIAQFPRKVRRGPLKAPPDRRAAAPSRAPPLCTSLLECEPLMLNPSQTSTIHFPQKELKQQTWHKEMNHGFQRVHTQNVIPRPN